jgi:hypothetical protein
MAVITLSVFALVTPLAWTYNLVPGFRVEPEERERRRCDRDFGEGYYHFFILSREWDCTDNWHALHFDAGVHGI